MSSDDGGGKKRSSNFFEDPGSVFQGAIDAARQAVDRSGRNFGNDLKDVAYAIGTGDLNNIGNSVINNTSNMLTMGQLNPNLQSGRERAEDAAAQAKERADVDSAIIADVMKREDKQRRVNSILEASARQRMKAPGSSATSIIPGGGGVNTLLTIKGGG